MAYINMKCSDQFVLLSLFIVYFRFPRRCLAVHEFGAALSILFDWETHIFMSMFHRCWKSTHSKRMSHGKVFQMYICSELNQAPSIAIPSSHAVWVDDC